MSKDTIKLAQEVIWSAETLLTKPAVVTDAALIAALQRRLREWRSHEAFALVRSFQIPPQSGELMRLLHRRPALFLLIIKKVIRSLYWRAFWGIGNLSSHWRA